MPLFILFHIFFPKRFFFLQAYFHAIELGHNNMLTFNMLIDRQNWKNVIEIESISHF